MNLTTLTIETLYQLNAPMRCKLDTGRELSTDEQDLHEAICAEVLARLEALRQHDRQERDERMAARYR